MLPKPTVQYKREIAELIDGGDMSSCYSDNEYDYEKQEFVKRDPRPEYYADRGRKSRTLAINYPKMTKSISLLQTNVVASMFDIFELNEHGVVSS